MARKRKQPAIRRDGREKPQPGPHPLGNGHSKRLNKRAAAPVKNRIRDIRRLLNHAKDLAADKRIELERELGVLEHDLDILQAKKRKAYMISKYHMVRFFGISPTPDHFGRAC
jgi:hypothetical protein